MCKNIILFRFAGSNKECLRNVSQMMEIDNVLVYKSKQTGNWYKWEKNSSGRPEALSKEEREELLTNPENKIINWGNHILRDRDNIICNKPSACTLSSNKWLTRKIWQENGIKTPLSSDDWRDMIDFPFIARSQHHARQAEFHVINNLRDFSNIYSEETEVLHPNYYQKIVSKTCEFRVYVTGDKVATIFWKGNGGQLLSSNSEWHWLDDVNWQSNKLPACIVQLIAEQGLMFVKNQIINPIKEECIKATKVLGLDYSGIDIGLDTYSHAFNLFESNTDPELTPLPQKKFAKYFDKVFRGE